MSSSLNVLANCTWCRNTFNHPLMKPKPSVLLKCEQACPVTPCMNSLGETLFKVTEKCIADEMATCITFMRNNLSCFIIGLSRRMRGSFTFLTEHLLFFAGIALFSLSLSKKMGFHLNFFLPILRGHCISPSQITLAGLWLKCFNSSRPL